MSPVKDFSLTPTHLSAARGENLNGVKQTSYFTLNLHLTMSFGWRPGEIPITLYRSKAMKLFSYVIASKKAKGKRNLKKLESVVSTESPHAGSLKQ